MERKEEIRQASIDYQLSTKPRAIGGDAFADMVEAYNVNPAFIAGANWADEHPNRFNDEKYHTVEVEVLDRLYKKEQEYDALIEKVCEWLKENVDLYYTFSDIEEEKENLVTAFCKAMGGLGIKLEN